MKPGALEALGKQVRKALCGDREEARIGRDAHDRLGDTERDDFGVGHPSLGVCCPLGQEIVGGAENRDQQQVEVGEHRRSFGSAVAESTADVDSLR